MAYTLSAPDLAVALRLHGEGSDGLAFRSVAEAIERDGGRVHPFVIDWLLLSAEAGRKKAWAKALGFKLNSSDTERLNRSTAQNFFSLLRRDSGLVPTVETIVSISGMSALRELGAESTKLARFLPAHSPLHRHISGKKEDEVMISGG